MLAENRRFRDEHPLVRGAMGVVQVAQPSRVGACSHRKGPRLSAWQDVHSSAIESPFRSSLTFVDPCGLWQVEHSILPSRTGTCPERLSLATLSRWHVTQRPICVGVLSCACSDLKLWMRAARDAGGFRHRGLLPEARGSAGCGTSCRPRSPHAAGSSRRRESSRRLTDRPRGPTRGPWQVSHPWLDAGDRA